MRNYGSLDSGAKGCTENANRTFQRRRESARMNKQKKSVVLGEPTFQMNPDDSKQFQVKNYELLQKNSKAIRFSNMPKAAKPNMLFTLYDDGTCCLQRYQEMRD